MNAPFQLSDAERSAAVHLFDYIEKRIQALHRENEKPEHDEVQTALRRGQIKAFREILRLQDGPKFQESPPG